MDQSIIYRTAILAMDSGKAIGRVGLRKAAPGISELKRLYLRDSHRGYKIGLQMVLEKARTLGYMKFRPDVIPALLKAKEWYRSFGFYEIPPIFIIP